MDETEFVGGSTQMDKGDHQRINRRQALRWIIRSHVFFALSRTQLWPKEGASQGREANVEKEGCPYDSIVPNTKPIWKAGQVFRYETTKTQAMKPSPPTAMTGRSGQIVLTDDPIPLQQTIIVDESSDFSGEKVVSIRREGIVDIPIPSSNGQASKAGVKDQSKSYVNAHGRIRYTESKWTMTIDQSTSVSTNKQVEIPPVNDLHYFYGYWMLALGPNFSWECLKDTPEGSVFEKLKVTGLESVNGRACYVVERTVRTSRDGSRITTYWIDKEDRIALQVKKGIYTIRLVQILPV